MYTEQEIKDLYDICCHTDEDVMLFTKMWKEFVNQEWMSNDILIIVRKVALQHIEKLWN